MASRESTPEQISRAWIRPVLTIAGLLALVGVLVQALGFGPVSTTGDRLVEVESRIATLEKDHGALTVLLPILFCRDATPREQALARQAVDCATLTFR